MKNKTDYIHFIEYSLKNFSFENYDFGRKWLNILKNNNNERLLLNNLENFRKSPLIIGDHYPASRHANLFETYYFSSFIKNPLKFLYEYIYEKLPFSLIHRSMIKDQLNLLIKEGAGKIIESFPVSKTPGNPNYFTYKNYDVNESSLKHYYYLNIITKKLGDKIESNSIKTVLDIGGGYGFYNALFKNIYPNTTQILIDFRQNVVQLP